uniref:C2H2-type domain-containing protein n=1 Tax=Pygocentrus nattereri TaxID=42514 RepID=A0AAR2M613_PYGNA
MTKMEHLNSFFIERLMSVAAEIFEAIQDTVSEYQVEIERAKRENRRLRERLTEINSRLRRRESLTQESLDSKSSFIQVKVELSTMHQDTEPQGPLNNPTSSSSPSAETVNTKDPLHNCLGITIKEEKVDYSYHLSRCKTLSDHFCQLKQHQVVHQKNRPRPYRCDLCGKSYSYAQVLENHRRTHTGERPYNCRFCGRCFKQRGHLIDHERIHTGERPFSCSVCGKRFIQSSQVKKHVRNHHQIILN